VIGTLVVDIYDSKNQSFSLACSRSKTPSITMAARIKQMVQKAIVEDVQAMADDLTWVC